MAQTPIAPWDDPKATPLIRFEGVTKTFGTFTAIDTLSLDIYEREFFALLGPSGCGKTTMMRMLAGFEQLTSGRILLDGQDIGQVPPNQRPVNMMFQSYALFPHLSVWDNIAFGLRREKRGKDEINKRVDEMLRLTRLEKFAQRKPHQISGGQRQRVALARSLAKAPKLLLLDEPLGALDKKLREETQFELMDIQEKTGTTFVIVTHDQEEAMTVASRVAVMDEGRICQVATPETIYEAPNSVYVADFIGSVTLFHGLAKKRETPVAPPPPPARPAAIEPPAPDNERRARPNALGIWLHDKLLYPILGQRRDAPRLLPPPSEPDVAPPPPKPPSDGLPPGGLSIHWSDAAKPLIALNGDTALEGQPVVLAIRPEKVAISKVRPDAPNVLPGKVIDIAYLGNVSTYHVQIKDGPLIKAQMTNASRQTRRNITWEDAVWISFSATAGIVLKAT